MLMTSEVLTREMEISSAGLSYPALCSGWQGPLVICLHGFPDNYEGYRAIAEHLAGNGYQVVCPLLPGYHPHNQRDEGEHDALYVRDALIGLIETLLAQRRQQRCHLVAHDWGAVIACLIAQRRPDLLISLCAMSVPYGMTWRKVALRCPTYLFNAWYIALIQLRGLSDWLIRRKGFYLLKRMLAWWSPRNPQLRQMQRAVVATFREPGVLRAALEYYRSSMFSLRPKAFRIRSLFDRRIEVPTLAIRGEQDVTMPQAVWEVISPRAFPRGITLELLPEAGHFIQYERPAEIAERLLQWFATTQPSPAGITAGLQPVRADGQAEASMVCR